ncbi:hypothetical protein ACFVRT_10355 [Arthrobacter koreensis]|uniref:hypothetical protein n=1 Tax=Arthrobacter koreensis TaxID=199136 RepID=UPI0036DD1A0E
MTTVLFGSALNQGELLLTFPPGVKSANISAQISSEVGDRELVARIDVYDANGTDISRETKGLNYSRVLDGTYRYVPSAAAPSTVSLAVLEFPSPVSSLVVTFLDWKVQGRRISPVRLLLMGLFESPGSNPTDSKRYCTVFATEGS